MLLYILTIAIMPILIGSL